MGTPVACLSKRNGEPQEFKMGIGAEWQAENCYQMARVKVTS